MSKLRTAFAAVAAFRRAHPKLTTAFAMVAAIGVGAGTFVGTAAIALPILVAHAAVAGSGMGFVSVGAFTGLGTFRAIKGPLHLKP